MSSKIEIWVAVRALTMFEAVQKAYEVCASVDLLVNEQSLLEISYDEYMQIKTINRLKVQ